jgi:hypothetical protein
MFSSQVLLKMGADVIGSKCHHHVITSSRHHVFFTGALEDGVRMSSGQNLPGLASYESNVLYALRFMVDTNMGGGQWLEIPAGKHRQQQHTAADCRSHHCISAWLVPPKPAMFSPPVVLCNPSGAAAVVEAMEQRPHNLKSLSAPQQPSHLLPANTFKEAGALSVVLMFCCSWT